uniref:Uncharacterized protein n=1 Tax=Parascaris equorum TaxID=6256 RepID=A0A914RD82_PAREQ
MFAGHYLYLTEGAKPPSPRGVIPNSNILSPIVCTDVLSTYRSGEMPEKKPICLTKLDVVPYRDGWRRFKFTFSLRDFDVKKKKFHAELYEYYNSHWEDKDLMMKLKVGDHAVFYDSNRDCVRRICYVGEEENGSLRVYLIDDLIYASIMPSSIRKVRRITYAQ